MKIFEFKVENSEKSQRVDLFIFSKFPELTRTEIQNLIVDKNVFLNGKSVKKNKMVKTGDTVWITIPDPKKLDVDPENIPIEIVYEDADIAVVNKQKGMVVHPAPGNYTGTLVNALLYRMHDSLSGINGVMRPGIVHRIDKNTSGLLIVAKNDFSHKILAEKIKTHDFLREYEAVVYGQFKKNEDTIIAPIGRNPNDRKKMSVTDKNCKSAVTHYKVLDCYEDSSGLKFSHVRLTLETGRTHQIRVHMSHIGHPVAGDEVYGPRKVIKELRGQCLHAKTIGFEHPRTGEFIKIESDLPDYFKNFMKKLKKMY